MSPLPPALLREEVAQLQEEVHLLRQMKEMLTKDLEETHGSKSPEVLSATELKVQLAQKEHELARAKEALHGKDCTLLFSCISPGPQSFISELTRKGKAIPLIWVVHHVHVVMRFDFSAPHPRTPSRFFPPWCKTGVQQRAGKQGVGNVCSVAKKSPHGWLESRAKRAAEMQLETFARCGWVGFKPLGIF